MANTNSAKKAVKSSKNKKVHNLFWEKQIKDATKAIRKSIEEKVSDPKVLSEQLKTLQKTADKATKEKVIHKNKANRVKSRYAHKVAALVQKKSTKSK